MRVLKQPGRVRIFHSCAGISQGLGDKPRERVDQHQRWQFATRDDIISNRDLMGGQVYAHTLVHTLVPPAQDRQVRVLDQLSEDSLCDDLALWREQDHGARRRLSESPFHRVKDRLGLHHHPAAPSIGLVIRHFVTVRRPVPDIVDLKFHQVILARFFQDTCAQVRFKQVRK